jgi:hypothetical protein
LIVVRLVILAWVVLLGAGAASAADSKKKDREAVAIVAGTVFQSSGHLLRGAKVEAVAQDPAAKKISTVTDAQGDFAMRVPAGRGTYVVTATAKGFQAAQKTVEVYEDERVRTNLILTPEAKN